MPKSCFWALDRSGQMFYLNLNDMKWRTEKPNVAKQSFKKLSAQEHCAWGIGANQRVYMCVFASDIPIRVQESCFENQRWSMLQGWSAKAMIFTDRPHWSSEDGTKACPKESFQLEPNWKWEAEWYIDESIECDSMGWQYAVDFPRRYHKEKGKTSFVRRRKWSRFRCFSGFGKWIEVPWKERKSDPFQDITIGGAWLPRQAPGYLATWALTFCGKLLYREGISNIHPEGMKWIYVDGCEDLNLIQVSVGPSGLVWGVQWNGKLLARVGISYQNPVGTAWKEIEPPTHGSSQTGLAHVSVGMNAVWVIANGNKIYYRKGIDGTQAYTDDRYACGTGWVEMVGEFKLISVGPNDQVWTIDKEGGLVIRTDISPNEPVGRKWKLLKSAPELSEVDSKFSNGGICHWTWINSGGCNVDSEFFKNIESSLKSARSSCGSLGSIKMKTREPWKVKTLDYLRKRNEREIERYRSFDKNEAKSGSVQWSRGAKCRMLIDKVYNLWCDCHIKFQSAEDDNEATVLIYYTNRGQYEEIRIPLMEITCVNLVMIPSHPNTFVINTLERTFRRKALIISMDSEKEANEWILLICVETAKVRQPHKRKAPSKDSIWVTNVSGDVFYCSPSTSEDFALDTMFWLQVGGHMKKVTAGVEGIVWGIGFDGKAYAYSGGEGGGILQGHEFSQDEIYEQEDSEEVFIYENQRWNPIQGFSERRLPSDRWAWSDETGTYNCPKEGYRLPSSQWQWIGDWEVVYVQDETDDDGWQYAVDFPRKYSKYRGINDYVRRRRWKRKSKLKTTGPWLLVESDMKLADVAIQTDPGDTVAFCVAVWAVSVKGDVYCRDGVHSDNPTGRTWRHIPANDKFISISMGSNRKVWGIAKDGSAYLRAGFGSDAQIGTQWFRCVGEKLPLRQISVGTNMVLALDNKGRLYRRDQITKTFPEGTDWVGLMDGFSSVSVGFKNNTWIVRGDDVEICVGKDLNNPTGSGVICVLSGGWNTVCIRGCTPELEEGDECIDVSSPSDDAPPSVTAVFPKIEASPFKKEIVDPEVSIFDLYRTDYSDNDFSDDLDSADEEDSVQHF